MKSKTLLGGGVAAMAVVAAFFAWPNDVVKETPVWDEVVASITSQVETAHVTSAAIDEAWKDRLFTSMLRGGVDSERHGDMFRAFDATFDMATEYQVVQSGLSEN